jgi:hypothetical protein
MGKRSILSFQQKLNIACEPNTPKDLWATAGNLRHIRTESICSSTLLICQTRAFKRQMPPYSGKGMNSVSPGISAKHPAFQTALACSMREMPNGYAADRPRLPSMRAMSAGEA